LKRSESNYVKGLPQKNTIKVEALWKKIETTFNKNKEGEPEIYTAAWLLIFDAWLYIYGYYQSKDESMSTHLADITRDIDAPPLRIAHCIRDLVYGDESRTEDLVSLVRSDDPEYREIFETAYWRSKSK
jgi:hypothetical protein